MNTMLRATHSQRERGSATSSTRMTTAAYAYRSCIWVMNVKNTSTEAARPGINVRGRGCGRSPETITNEPARHEVADVAEGQRADERHVIGDELTAPAASWSSHHTFQARSDRTLKISFW